MTELVRKPATSTESGEITTGDQTFAGNKSFTGEVVINGTPVKSVWVHYLLSSGAAIGHNIDVNFGTEVTDNTNSYDGTTFTAPYDGFYNINATLTLSDQSITSGIFIGIDLYVNASVAARLDIFESTSTTTQFQSINGSVNKFLSQGDTLTIRTNFSGGTYAFQTGVNSHLSIAKLG